MKKTKRVKRCYVLGCRRPHHARGLCAPHYERLRRLGSVFTSKPIRFGQKRVLVFL
jgi:hypothetical protein